MRFATEKLVAQMFREERLFCLFVHHFQLQPVLIDRLFQGTKIKLACILASVFVPDFIPDFRHIINEVGILEAVFDANFPLQKQANPQGKWQVLLGQLKWALYVSEKNATKYILCCRTVSQEESQDSSAEHLESSCHTFILSLPGLIMSLLPQDEKQAYGKGVITFPLVV